jgi:MFS family permease
MFCVGSLWSFLPLIADTKYDMSSSTIGFLMSLIVFSNAVLSYPIGMLADKMSKRFLVFLGGGFLTTSSTAMSAVIGKKLGSTGSVMSLVMVGHSAGMFTGPLLSGIIMDYTGNINAAFQIGGIVALILLMIAYVLTKDYHLVEKNT